ncbi:Peptidase A1 domain-containing protein [Heracleum sosnowskyi]|uniref:Peptidase A1 domain-containing protein n=1 Tax=Heracleum sosnowskyi TaxID=360622 RepID=A0AAD8J1E3_9APIA|nr:Peptidase A1 domain-containing protein [Heracleum sosnowskyi]
MSSFFFTCFFFLFLLSNSIHTSFSLTPKGVKLPLLHRSSLPMYSNETFQYILETNHKFLTLKFAEAKYIVETPMIHFSTAGLVYFLNVSVGNPPVPQYLLIDTGSSLTWVSGHDPRKQYVYDPYESDTFMFIGCSDPKCTSNSIFTCHEQNKCGYTTSYGDGSGSSGLLGYDDFGFVKYSDPDNPSMVEGVFFGALSNISSDMKVDNDPRYNGILGIGPENTSLINHLPGPKLFRYCAANLSSPNEPQGYFFFGELEGDYDDVQTTPIIQGYDQYIVEIVSICLDGVCLEIDPSVFKNIQGNGYTGVLIDTGTVLSYLADGAYDAVEQAVSKIMESKNKKKSPNKASRLCYEGYMNDLVHEYYPTLTINFSGGGAKMIITHTEYLVQYFQSSYCLAFGKASEFGEIYKNRTIIGLLSQQNHIFEFDLDHWALGILGDTTCDVPL